MSLFPSATSTEKPDERKSNGTEWLVNASFRPVLETRGIVPVRKETASQKRKLEERDDEHDVDECYAEDTAESHRHHHKKKRKKEKSGYREEKHDRHYDVDSQKHRDHDKSRARRKLIWLDDVAAAGSSATFVEDFTGDRNRTSYSSDHTGGALYKRRFRNICLGLRENLELRYADYRRSKDKEGRKDHKSKVQSARYFSKAAAQRLSAVGDAVQVCPSAQVDSSDQFLLLCTESNMNAVPEENTVLSGHAKYHSLLAKEPHNVQLWLKFVDDEGSHEMTVGDTLASSKATAVAIQERKMAILEQALTKNPASIDLLLKQIEVGESLWDEAKLAQRWKVLLHTHAASHRVWSQYLHFIRREASRCAFRSVSAAFGQCFDTLSAICSGVLKSHQPEPNSEDFLLDVLTSYCSFLQQAGYCERAVALYQAMIEFNMFCPDQLLDKPRGACLAFFDAFWDSNVARIGRPGSPGWKHWQSTVAGGTVSRATSLDLPTVGSVGDAVPDLDAEEALEEALIKPQHSSARHSAWVECEQSRESRHWCPWTADEDCDDPDRCVLVDDVRSILFRLSSPEHHLRLVLDFLSFLGVETPIDIQHSALKKTCSQFDCSSALHQLTPLLSGIYGSMQVQTWCSARQGVACFAGQPVDAVKTAWLSCGQVQHFVDCIFRQAAPCFSGCLQTLLLQVWMHHQTQRCSLSLTYCQRETWLQEKSPLKRTSKEVRAWAKVLLKRPENRANVALWELYGRFELALGMHDDACLVFGKVLTLASAMASDSASLATSPPALIKLYSTYVQALLTLIGADKAEPNCDLALSVLASCVSGKPFRSDQLASPPPSTQLLRSRRAFESLAGELQAPAAGDPVTDYAGRVAHIACLHCLFLYCSNDDMSAVQETAFDYAAKLRRRDEVACSWAAEAVLSLLIRLYHVQFCKKSLPLRMCTGVIERALQLFPHNCEWLAIYSRLLSPVHLMFQCRRFVDQCCLRPSSPSLVWAASVLLELERFQAYSSGSQCEQPAMPASALNRVRNILERALQQPQCSQSVLLWRLFLYVEGTFGSSERAVGVLYRAIHHCPVAKVLFMDGARVVADKLEELTDILNEKEVRVRMPLEELDLIIETLASAETGGESR
eukprot:scpid26069/ scgid21217/ UPF0614 protein C14orf102